MCLRLAAIAALSLASCAGLAQQQTTLSLDDAFERVAETHPELRLLGARRDALSAQHALATQRPALVLSAELENALGTGDARGLSGAELTLSLASVFERGGKLEARRRLAESRIDALAIERETVRLDLLAETARRYLDVVAAERFLELATLDITQRQRSVDAAQRRYEAGASPESVLLTAKAALARAELSRDRAMQQGLAARYRLAALWGERDPVKGDLVGDPLRLPLIQPLSALADVLDETPELTRFADETRIAEAQLRLASSEAASDIGWQFGLRRMEGSDDSALVAGISLPLGSRTRAQPGIRAAEVELARLSLAYEAADLALYGTLVDAHGRFSVSREEAARLASDVLPALERAQQAAEKAFRRGASSFQEWSFLLSEQTAARRQQLEAALQAQRALIEIQRLVGQPMTVAGAADTTQGMQP